MSILDLTNETERLKVADAVTRLAHLVDVKDWQGLKNLFADSVEVDYTSLRGGAPAVVAADDLLEGWKTLLPGFDVTQHLLGPVLVRFENDLAHAESHVRGYHYIKGAEGGEVWMVAGNYVIRLSRELDDWKISALKLETYYQEGNLNLPSLAQERVQS